jgi:hypothetical protein
MKTFAAAYLALYLAGLLLMCVHVRTIWRHRR